MPHAYPPSSYDDFMCLKPPFLLWLAAVYLSRAVTLPIILGFGAMGGGSSDITAFVGGLVGLGDVVPSLIAAPVLFALIRRAPSGSKAVRWIWARGRILLSVAAGADCLLLLYGRFGPWASAGSGAGSLILAGALDLYFLVYVVAAQHVRHAFAEFPTALDAPPV